MKIMQQRRENKKLAGGMRSKKAQEEITCYLMLATQIIGFILLSAYPIIWTFRWAWYSYQGVASEARFIGCQNFINMFIRDFTYWKVWLNTLIFTFCKIPIELPIAMILALLLNQKLKATGFFRTMYYLPNVVSIVIGGLIFSNMFSYWGYINNILLKLGWISKEIDWFSNRWTATVVLVLSGVWNTFGVNVMYFLAALANVPEELYECARLDGASAWTVFRKVTLPMITPVFKIILLMSIVGTLGVNEHVLVLTNGAPQGQTFTVMSYLTKQFVPGFASTTTPNLGYGCAMSIVTTILFAFIAFVYNGFSKRMTQE